MFLTGSFLLIFLTGRFTTSPPPAHVVEDRPGRFTTSPPPAHVVEDRPGPIWNSDHLPEYDNNDGSRGPKRISDHLPENDNYAGVLGPIRIPISDHFPENDDNDARVPGRFTTSPPPAHVVEDRPGPIPNSDHLPEYDNFDVGVSGGLTDHTVCGIKGMFDSPEFDATYRLNMSNPPEYLKEYYANFNDRQDPCAMHCSYSQVINALELDQQKNKLTMSRPVENYHTLTYVYLEMSIAAILNVKENDQLFVAHIWLYTSWHNKFIFWNPNDFCGIKHIIVPTDTLWKPDVIIEEMVEKDKTAPSPFLKINSFGEVEHRIDQVVMGACSINVYKFPFDVQRCNISFKSLLHSDEEIRFVVNKNTTVVSKWATYVMQSQHEWIFVKMTVSSKTTSYYSGANQTVIVYTVFMQRRAVLHAANFLLPIFFFLCMDLASFLIPDGGGEKITFRITVLLAVTVLQLILHEILPCSSTKLPLIAVYCIGIFLMMLISLLEAILARYLVQKDSETQDHQTDAEQSRNLDRRASCFDASKESKNCTRHSFLCHTLVDKTLSETKEVNNEKPSEVNLNFTKAADEREKYSSLFRKEEEKPGYWTRQAKKINRGFFILYLTTATVFLVYMFSLWIQPGDD